MYVCALDDNSFIGFTTRLVGIMLQIFFIILFQISLSKFLHYTQFYSFYGASSITILYLQLKLPIKVSYTSYLMLVVIVEPCTKKYSFHFH